jgi:hypothetical protein
MRIFLCSFPPVAKKSKSENQLVAMLLLVSCTLLFLTSPVYIRLIAVQTVDYRDSPSAHANFILVYHLTNKLSTTNYAINFFLYVLGGTGFRRDVKKLLTRK